MKKQLFFLAIAAIGFIQFMNAQEYNYCGLNNIRMTIYTPAFKCKYCDWQKEIDIKVPMLINSSDLKRNDEKCIVNSLVMYLTVTHFFVWYAGNSYTHSKCYSRNNPSGEHIVTVDYINKNEEIVNISKNEIISLIELMKEYDGKIDHESFLEGMKSSIKWASEILKH